MTTKTTKICLALLSVVLPGLVMTGMIDGNNQGHADVEMDAEIITDIFPKVNVSELQKQEFVERSKQIDGVKSYSVSGWEYGDIEFYGVTEPIPEWTNAVVTLKLVDQTNAIKRCDYGVYATVDFDLKTGEIIESNFPTKDTVCTDGIELGRSSTIEISQGESDIPDFIPQADAGNYFYAATNDNTGKYGGWVFVTTPTVDESEIYDGMDEFLGFTFNQDFGTSKFLQTGWLITTKESCTNCGINANSTNMVYVDEAHWGDLKPRKMAGTTYTDNATAILYIQCEAGKSDYQIKMWYGSQMYTRDSGVACTNTTTGAATDNSVFLENANTVTSSGWSDDITTVVKAWAADEYDTSTSTQEWQSSSAKRVICSGTTYSTTYIDGDLASSNTAEWDSLSLTGVAC